MDIVVVIVVASLIDESSKNNEITLGLTDAQQKPFFYPPKEITYDKYPNPAIMLSKLLKLFSMLYDL